MIGRSRGFTLVELLVAMFITAILFAMGYGAMNQAISNREGIQKQQQRLTDVQRAMRLMVQDFAQAAPRPVRDAIGGATDPAFKSGTPTGVLVTLTRGGWSNPAGVQRPTLQRVQYVFADGTLRRENFPVLDAVADVKPRERPLLADVRSVKLRYLADGGQWVEVWPPPQSTPNAKQRDRLLPNAVEVTLELTDWGKLVRIIEVAY